MGSEGGKARPIGSEGPKEKAGMMGCRPLLVMGIEVVGRAGTGLDWTGTGLSCTRFTISVMDCSVVPTSLGAKIVTGAGGDVCDREGVWGFLDLRRPLKELFLVNKLFRILEVGVTNGIFVSTPTGPSWTERSERGPEVSLVLDLSPCIGSSLPFGLSLAPILLELSGDPLV